MVSFSGIQIQPEELISSLKRQVQLKPVCRSIICQKIVSQAAQARGIEVTPEEIQAEADRLRYENRLESATATYAWLADQLISPDDWELGICDRILAQKLAHHLFGDEVEKQFSQKKLDFEQLILYRIAVPYQPLAQELFYQIEESEISFYEAAHFYDIDEQRRLRCGYEGKIYRWSLKPDIAAHLFSARLREVVGPFPSEHGYDLFLVEDFVSPDLTSQLYDEILDRLFQGWLENELNYAIHNSAPSMISNQE